MKWTGRNTQTTMRFVVSRDWENTCFVFLCQGVPTYCYRLKSELAGWFFASRKGPVHWNRCKFAIRQIAHMEHRASINITTWKWKEECAQYSDQKLDRSWVCITHNQPISCTLSILCFFLDYPIYPTTMSLESRHGGRLRQGSLSAVLIFEDRNSFWPLCSEGFPEDGFLSSA